MNVNANTPVLSNFNTSSTRSNGNSFSPLPSSRTGLGERDIRISGGGINMVNLFYRDYGDVGCQILKYLFSKDVRTLREVSADMCSTLFQKGAFNLSVTPHRISSIRPYIYPRLYPRVQSTNCVAGCLTFQPLPADAIVKNANDLKRILEDKRFVIKSVVFTGKIEDLRLVREALPQNLKESLILRKSLPEGRIEEQAEHSASGESNKPEYPDEEQKYFGDEKVKSPYNRLILPAKDVTVLCEGIERPKEEPLEDIYSFLPRREEELIEDIYSFLPKKEEEAGESPYDFSRELSCLERKQIIDSNIALFNSFIGVNRISVGAVKIGEYIGGGNFGKVYKGTWGNRSVALKILKTFLSMEKEPLSWEISRLSTVNHSNVVQFYGIYQQENGGGTYLVMELCEGSTLQGALEKETVPWSKRWQWALQITEALEYLHSEGVLHRDLKAENVLLDSNGRAKLADLGLAQVDALLEENELQQLKQGKQDKRFIAPENVDNPTVSTQATDVYALGVIFWQIVSNGQEPGGIDFKAWKEGKLIERMPIPIDCPPSFKQLILDCWQTIPSKRPSAQELVSRLAALGAEFDPYHHTLVKCCEKLETLIYPKRKEGLSYVAPFVTEHPVEESIESYWNRMDSTKAKGEARRNPPLDLKMS